MLFCTHSRECLQDICSCLQNKMKSTYLCKLSTYANQVFEDDEEEFVSDNNEEE